MILKKNYLQKSKPKMKIFRKLTILAILGSATKLPNQNDLFFKRGFQQMMFQRGFQQMIGDRQSPGASDYSDISSLFY